MLQLHDRGMRRLDRRASACASRPARMRGLWGCRSQYRRRRRHRLSRTAGRFSSRPTICAPTTRIGRRRRAVPALHPCCRTVSNLPRKSAAFVLRLDRAAHGHARARKTATTAQHFGLDRIGAPAQSGCTQTTSRRGRNAKPRSSPGVYARRRYRRPEQPVWRCSPAPAMRPDHHEGTCHAAVSSLRNGAHASDASLRGPHRHRRPHGRCRGGGYTTSPW